MSEFDIEKKLEHLKTAYNTMPNSSSTLQIIDFIEKHHQKKKRQPWIPYIATIVCLFLIVAITSTQLFHVMKNTSSNTVQPSAELIHSKTNQLNQLKINKEKDLAKSLGLNELPHNYTFVKQASAAITAFNNGTYDTTSEMSKAYKRAVNDMTLTLMLPGNTISELQKDQKNMTKREISNNINNLLTKMGELGGTFGQQLFDNLGNNRSIISDIINVVNGNGSYPPGTSQEIIDRANDIRENYYMLIKSEGGGPPSIGINYSKIRNQVVLPKNYQEYFAIQEKALNVNDPYNLGLKSSMDDLSDEIVRIEHFVEKYPNFDQNNTLNQEYKRFLYYYITVISITPAPNSTPENILANIKPSYERFLKKYPNTKTYVVVKDFYDVLSKSNFKKSDQVLNYKIQYPNLN